MALSPIIQAFQWGSGGRAMTQEEIDRQRRIAEALMARGSDTSPVGHVTQGLARLVDAFGGVMAERRAQRGADEISGLNEDYRSQIARMLSGDPAPVEVPPGAMQVTPETMLGGDMKAGPIPETPAASAPVTGVQRGLLDAPGAPSTGDARRDEFIQSIWPGVLQASRETGVLPEIILAQAALESGWGQHTPGNNAFGIKSHGEPGGQTLTTTEYVNGQPVQIQDSFRTYDTLADSVAGYSQFLRDNPRYGPLMQAQGLDAQLAALGASGYATDPNYANTVGQIARSFTGASMPSPAPGPVRDSAVASPRQAAAAGGGGHDVAALLGIMSDPRADEQTRQVAGLLMQQAMQPGPAPIEVGGVLLDPVTYQPLFDSRRPDQTAAMQNYEYLVGMGIQPEQAIERAFSGGVNVNTTVQSGEGAYSRSRGEQDAMRFQGYQDAGRSAVSRLSTLDRMEQITNDPNFYSGAASGLVQMYRQGISALGGNPDAAAPMEEFASLANTMALENMGGSLGAGFSNADRDFVIQMVPSLDTTQAGNQARIEVLRRMARRDLEIAQMAQEYEAQTGRLDAGFDRMVADFAEANPLFGDMRQQRAGAAGASTIDLGPGFEGITVRRLD